MPDVPKSFTLQRNGGIKTIISHKNERIALISNNEKNCFFASLFFRRNEDGSKNRKNFDANKENTKFK